MLKKIPKYTNNGRLKIPKTDYLLRDWKAINLDSRFVDLKNTVCSTMHLINLTLVHVLFMCVCVCVCVCALVHAWAIQYNVLPIYLVLIDKNIPKEFHDLLGVSIDF